jgi:hypothetical protein
VALVAGQITASTTAALIHQTDADGCTISISADIGAGQHVRIGPLGVTTSNGFILDGQNILTIQLPPAAALYGVLVSGTCIVSKLVSD